MQLTYLRPANAPHLATLAACPSDLTCSSSSAQLDIASAQGMQIHRWEEFGECRIRARQGA